MNSNIRLWNRRLSLWAGLLLFLLLVTLAIIEQVCQFVNVMQAGDQKRYQLSSEFLQKKLNPFSETEAQLNQAGALAAKNPKEAILIIDTAIRHIDDQLSASDRRDLAAGQSSPAFRKRAQLLARMYRVRAYCHFYAGNNDLAIADLSQVLVSAPTDAYSFYNRAELYRQTDRFSFAARDFSRARALVLREPDRYRVLLARLDPRDVHLWESKSMGGIIDEKGNVAGADQEATTDVSYEQTLQESARAEKFLEPINAPLKQALIQADILEFDKAMKPLNQALAQTYALEKRIDSSNDPLLKYAVAYKLNQRRYQILLERADCERELDQYANALKDANAVIPYNRTGLFVRARIYEQMHKNDLAKKDIDTLRDEIRSDSLSASGEDTNDDDQDEFIIWTDSFSSQKPLDTSLFELEVQRHWQSRRK